MILLGSYHYLLFQVWQKEAWKTFEKSWPNIFETARTFRTNCVHKAKKEQPQQVDTDVGMPGRNLQTVMRLI